MDGPFTSCAVAATTASSPASSPAPSPTTSPSTSPESTAPSPTESELTALMLAAKAAFVELFEGGNTKLWSLSVPPSGKIGVPSKQTYTVLSPLCNTESNEKFAAIVESVLTHIRQGVERLFTNRETLLNGTFWENVVKKLGLDLINAGGLVHSSLYKRNEATVVTDLLLPLLKRIAHSASMNLTGGTVDPHALVYHSFLEVEVPTEERKHVRGKKPTVDFLMYGTIEGMEGEDSAIYVIPVEAKRVIDTKDVAQICQYMSTLVHGAQFRNNTTVGMLLDDMRVRFAFSVMCDSERPLPIVFVSPPMLWRNGVFPLSQTCICMCLLQNLRLPRMPVTEEWSAYFGEGRWKDIERVSIQVKRDHPFKPVCGKPRTFLTDLEAADLKAEVADLKKEVDELRALCAPQTPPSVVPHAKRRRAGL